MFDNERCLKYVLNKNTMRKIQTNILTLSFQYFTNSFYCGIFILEMPNEYHFTEKLKHIDP